MAPDQTAARENELLQRRQLVIQSSIQSSNRLTSSSPTRTCPAISCRRSREIGADVEQVVLDLLQA